MMIRALAKIPARVRARDNASQKFWRMLLISAGMKQGKEAPQPKGS